MPLSPSYLRTGRARVVTLAAVLTVGCWSGTAAAQDPPVEPTTPVAEVEGTTPADPVTPTTPPAEEPAQATPPTAIVAPAPTARVPYVEQLTGDFLPPVLAIGSARKQLDSARRKGLRVSYSVSEASTLRADVLIYGDVVDRELKMSALPAAGPGDSLAKATVTRTAVGTSVVRLAFNPAARRTLRKFLKITVLLRFIAADAAGNEKTAYKRITLSNL